MDRVAFYAPLKPPTHPVPSGDREMARNLISAIAANGAQVDLVSDLRIYDPRGATETQDTLFAQADLEIARLTTLFKAARPDFWVTYHNYYKAPDLIGPDVCRALGLPYLQIESTRSRRRLCGPWARFAAAAEAASDAACVIYYLTDNDLITLKRDRKSPQRLVRLRPFLPMDRLPCPADITAPPPPMLSVGMMREGDKLASYRIIAETLACLESRNWQLDIAGDGPARAEVEEMMAPFGPRVRFLGQLDQIGLAQAYQRSALFFWPGVNEAFGMVYLEAQSHGLAAVAQDRTGVRNVLAPGPRRPKPKEGPQALAAQIDALLSSPERRASDGSTARDYIAKTHLRGKATRTFWAAARRPDKGADQ